MLIAGRRYADIHAIPVISTPVCLGDTI